MSHTPANNSVPVEISPLWEKGFYQQSEKVQSLNEKPEIVGHDTVVKKHHHRFAFHLQRIKQKQSYIHVVLLEISRQRKCFQALQTC